MRPTSSWTILPMSLISRVGRVASRRDCHRSLLSVSRVLTATIFSMRTAAAILLMCPALSAATSESSEFFEKRVRPLLVRNCYGCHTATQMGGLQLDTREHILKGGN